MFNVYLLDIIRSFSFVNFLSILACKSVSKILYTQTLTAFNALDCLDRLLLRHLQIYAICNAKNDVYDSYEDVLMCFVNRFNRSTEIFAQKNVVWIFFANRTFPFTQIDSSTRLAWLLI